MPAKYWSCPRNCGGRWEKRYIKCRTPGCDGRRRKTRRPAHEEVLRGDTYPAFEQFNELVHGPAHLGEWTKDCCGVCGKPPKGKRNDRDHDHRTGNMRGLACPGDRGCNKLMLPWVTAATARGIALAKDVVHEPDALRWWLIAGYLERVEAHYAGRTE